MKNPNGYGSVVPLKGKRRRPYAVRITVGYDDNGKQKYGYLGYYETRKEALYQLSLYNANPYDIDLKSLTLQDIYQRYVDTKRNKVSKSRLNTYQYARNHLEPILNMRIVNIKTVHLQTLIDSFADRLSTGSIRAVKAVISSLFKYAMNIDIIDKDYTKFIIMPKHKAVIKRNIFTEAEIAELWNRVNTTPYIDTVLILIYTGMRIGELLNMRKANVNLEMRTLQGGSKTEAGKNRIIPIHPKIYPLIEKRMSNPTEYLIPNKKNKGSYKYGSFLKFEFNRIMEMLGMVHKPHDTRHTFATLITEVSQNKTAITEIIGHTDIRMTEKYTHTNIDKMRKEIEKIN